MYPSTLKVDLRNERRARLQQKAIMILFATVAGYVLGITTVLYILAVMQ